MIINKNIINSVIVILLLSAATSCFKKGFPAEKMLGTWNLKQATRDAKDITLMMGDAYFSFMEGNRLKSNFPLDIPVDEEVSYTLQEKKIINIEGAEDLIFDITELTDTSLVLLTNLRGSSFELKFKPKE